VNKKPSRKNPTDSMRKNLLRKNLDVCCVCKQPGGLELHHIDGNPSNTVEENLAVLCVRDHDKEQRPHQYKEVQHTDLSPDRIRRYKESWEACVDEVSKPNPEVLCFVHCYGVGETVQALRIAFQWGGQIVLERMIYPTDYPPQLWMDEAIKFRNWLGKHIQIVVEREFLPIEYCENCLSKKREKPGCLDPKLYGSITKKYTDPTWDTDSYVSIYIDPYKPFLTFGVVLRNEVIHGVCIYKQGKNISVFCSEPSCECQSSLNNGSNKEELSPKDLEKQIAYTLYTLLLKWEPARCNITTIKDNTSVLLYDTTFKDNDSVSLDLILLPEIWYEDSEFNFPDDLAVVWNGHSIPLYKRLETPS
jgi:hypothetical protein